jgi:hypothetical protein
MASSSEKRIVEADEFVLKDALGRVRAKLAMGEEGPALNLYDDSGQPRVTVGVATSGPALALYDANGKSRASVVVLADGPRLSTAPRGRGPAFTAELAYSRLFRF